MSRHWHNYRRPIDYVTRVPVPINQSSAEIEYNTACTAEMV